MTTSPIPWRIDYPANGTGEQPAIIAADGREVGQVYTAADAELIVATMNRKETDYDANQKRQLANTVVIKDGG